MENQNSPEQPSSWSWQYAKSYFKKTALLTFVVIVGIVGSTVIGSLLAVKVNAPLGIVVSIAGFIVTFYALAKLRRANYV